MWWHWGGDIFLNFIICKLSRKYYFILFIIISNVKVLNNLYVIKFIITLYQLQLVKRLAHIFLACFILMSKHFAVTSVLLYVHDTVRSVSCNKQIY